MASSLLKQYLIYQPFSTSDSATPLALSYSPSSYLVSFSQEPLCNYAYHLFPPRAHQHPITSTSGCARAGITTQRADHPHNLPSAFPPSDHHSPDTPTAQIHKIYTPSSPAPPAAVSPSSATISPCGCCVKPQIAPW